MSSAAERWRQRLAAWAIPDDILTAAPESPYGFATECFRRRGERAAAAEPTPTTLRALDMLPEGGSVLDVGVGGGGTSLPLAKRAGSIVGFDAQADMLEGFRENAAGLGVRVETITGVWPEDAGDAPLVDVVVAGHVCYNTPDLGPFAQALDRHARRRVVLELTERHPLAWMSDLWMTFHGLSRPDGPTASDAEAVLREVGLDVTRADWRVSEQHGTAGFARREEAIHQVRRRLCLSADRDDEISDALGDRLRLIDGLWDLGPDERTLITLWWDQRPEGGWQPERHRRLTEPTNR
jgi:2-polyprenyl-3-methyl-5-hydroxy-6-metoxy-1,4-benzoquinol methylase